MRSSISRLSGGQSGRAGCRSARPLARLRLEGGPHPLGRLRSRRVPCGEPGRRPAAYVAARPRRMLPAHMIGSVPGSPGGGFGGTRGTGRIRIFGGNIAADAAAPPVGVRRRRRHTGRIRSGGAVFRHAAAADRQLHSDRYGHRIRDRPRHGGSAVRSVLGNRLTRTPDARERLPFFQSDCHSIHTHLSGRVCTDRPPWGRISERRLAQCFLSLRSCRGDRWVCPPVIWQAHERFDRALTATCDFLERGNRNRSGVCADLGRYGRT